MAATMDRNDGGRNPDQTRRDLADVLGSEGTRDIVREAIAQVGGPGEQDWDRRRNAFLIWLNDLERRVTKDLAAYGS